MHASKHSDVAAQLPPHHMVSSSRIIFNFSPPLTLCKPLPTNKLIPFCILNKIATEIIKGKTLDEIQTITNSEIASHLKLPPVKLHCSMLAEDAIKAAVKDYKQKQST